MVLGGGYFQCKYDIDDADIIFIE